MGYSRIINGKNISVFIEDTILNIYIKELENKYKKNSFFDLTIKPILQLHNKYSSENISIKLIKNLYSIFFRVIKDNISLVNGNNLEIYVNIECHNSGYAGFKANISSEGKAFFFVTENFLIHDFYSQIFTNKKLLNHISVLYIFTGLGEVTLYEVISHEFYHYIDIKKGYGERIKIFERLREFFNGKGKLSTKLI